MIKFPTLLSFFLLVVFITLGVGLLGKDFLGKYGVSSPAQTDQKPKDINSNEITVRLQIRNQKNKAPIPSVNVEFNRLGVPITEYTDSLGYIDIKIPKTDFIKVYLSKPGFASVDYQIDPNIYDNNIIYYMKEVSTPQPEQKEVSPPQPEQKEVLLPSPTQNNPNSKTEPGNNKNNFTQQNEGFKVDLQDCIQQSQKIICRLKITSIKKDSPLRMQGNNGLSYRTRRIDTSGNEYIAKIAKIGTSENSVFAESDLIKDTPMNASVVFDEILPETNKIAVLEVSFYNKNSDTSFKLQFRNINLSR